MRLRALVLIVHFAAVVLGPGSARAQESADDQLVADGIALRKEGRDAEALALFERAQTLHPSARALAQIALAHQALTQWPEAERALLEALGQADDAWIARHRPYLEKSLAAVQSHLAWLSVDSNVAGAELFVRGELAGRLPLDGPLRVPTGTLVVEVRAEGYATTTRALQIEPGAKLHESLRLGAEGADAGGPPPSSNPIVEREIPPAPVRDTPAPTLSGRREAAWITLAGTGALLAGGIAIQARREHEVALYNDDNLCLRGPGSRDDVCGSYRSAANTEMAIAIALYAGSAALALTSTYLFVVSRSGSAARMPPATARVSCGLAGLGAACGGAF